MILNDQKKYIYVFKIMIVVGMYLIDLILQVINFEFINILFNYIWLGCDLEKVMLIFRRDWFV